MQTDNVVTHCGKHAFHLVITTFTDGQTHFGRRNHFQHRWLGKIFLIVQLNAFGELRGGVIADRIFQRHQVGFLAMMARRGDATEQIFFKPTRTETEDYITGRFG